MGKYLMGIDGGTTGCKSCVFDFEGNLIGSDYREYPCYYPNPGWVEQKVEDMTPAIFESCKAAIANSGVDPKEIIAMGFSSQGSTIGMLDKNGELLRDFIGWQDIRGGKEVLDKIQERIPRDEYYALTGDPLGNIFSIAKLWWLRENEPEVWKNTAMIADMQEYFLKQFGAEGYWTDLSTASRQGMCDVDNHCWAPRIFDVLEIRMDQRAKISTECGKVVGKISKGISDKCGLAEGTLLCMGAHDQNCNTFGSGGIDDGTAVMVVGTFGSCFVVSDKPIRDPNKKLVVKGNHGVGNWTIEAFSTTAASSFRWFRDTFGDLEVAAGKLLKKNPYDLLTSEIDTVPPGANGITFLSYLQGASGSRINSAARGTFVGMSLGTTKADMARACMEGICYEMNDILEAQKAAGININGIRLTGGAAQSPTWSQMLADISQQPIHLLSATETGCLGAALYAGIGAGIYKDPRDATTRAARIAKTYEPNPANFAAYQDGYQRFVNVYEALDGRIFVE